MGTDSLDSKAYSFIQIGNSRALAAGGAILWTLLGSLLGAGSAEAQRVFDPVTGDRAIRSLIESVEFVLTLSDDELRARVPVESGGVWFTDCPNCDFGSQDRGRFNWDPRDPHRIECQGCDAVYPDNPDYPDGRYIEVDAPKGTHRFAYWENPEDGYRIFFRAHADYLHRGYLELMVRNLGRLYAATGDDRYARPAAVLLHRFAEVVPGYAYIYDFPYRQKLFSPYTDDRLPVPDYRTSLWTRWAYNDIPQRLLEGYDCLYDWRGWDDVAGPATRERIEEDLFALIIRFVLSFEDPLTNMSPRIWQDAIYAGRIMDRPEWVHESIYRFERMLASRFLHDGHWYETSPSYHGMTINGMRRVLSAAQGHTDPPGYRHPETGRRFDDLDLARDVPQYGLAILAMEKSRLPSGRLLPLNDTWAVPSRVQIEILEPRESSESLFLPGLGVAILGGGTGNNQIVSWLNFTSGRAHKQRDTLSFGLYAHGEEILSDIGYTHTRIRRAWPSSMMSHNTVVVDGRESQFDVDHSGNRLVAFATDGAGFHLAAAESDAAYPDRTNRYRRTLLLAGNDSTDAYLLDVFEVTGGRQHDYLLHGSADRDSVTEIDGARLTAFDGNLVNPGAEYEEPSGEHDEMGPEGSFSFIRGLQRGDGGNRIAVDFRLAENPAIGSRSLLAPVAGTEVFLGRSPSLRRAEESDARINDYFMPSFVLRRRGEDPLDTVFTAVHEAVDGEPRLRDIRTWRRDGRVWVSVAHADGRDYFSIATAAPSPAGIDTPWGTFFTDASYAGVRLDASGNAVALHLVEGERLRFGDIELRGPGRFTGDVRGIEGGEAGQTVFELDRRLPVNRPQALIVKFPDGSTRAFSVTGIDEGDTGTRVQVREAAGFSIDDGSIKITSYPQRTIEGTALAYRLVDSAHKRR